jgi:tetratricopeptide (TPR) repeat protein
MKTVLSIFIFVCFAMVASGQYANYRSGVEAYKAGNYKEAIAHLTEFLGKPRRDKELAPDVYYVRGLSFYKTKQYEKAVSDFESSLKLGHANKSNIIWFIANSYRDQGFPGKAIEKYSSALEAADNPRDEISILMLRSSVYRATGDTRRSLNDLYAARKIEPTNKAVLDSIAVYESASTSKPSVSLGQIGAIDTARGGDVRFALVIGNGNYRHVSALRNPVNDAADLSAILRELNFDVIELTDATYGEMRTAFQRFYGKLSAGPRNKTVGLFYFAGHGLQSDGENYLVPVDAQIEYEDDIARQCFPVQKIVLSNMERSNARMNILILDACRNNPFHSVTRNVSGGLTEMKRGKGSFVAYATSPGSTAVDGSGRNGLYTQELLRAINKPGLSIEQVFKEVRLNVLRLSGDKQNSWDSSNITGDFYFRPDYNR